MLFSTEQKNMMIGAFATGAVSTAFNAYWGYRYAGGVNIAITPTDPAYWLYTSFNYWLPNVEETIALLGVPALMYYIGGKKHSSKLRAMGVGAFVFGVSELLGFTSLKLVAAVSGAGGLSYKVLGAR